MGETDKSTPGRSSFDGLADALIGDLQKARSALIDATEKAQELELDEGPFPTPMYGINEALEAVETLIVDTDERIRQDRERLATVIPLEP